MTQQAEFRDSLVGFLHQELVGPDRADEVLSESPCRRYVAGILFPSHQQVVEAEDDRPEEVGREPGSTPPPEILLVDEPPFEPRKTGGAEEGDAVYDDTIAMANAFFPSAIGLSFMCDFPPDGLLVEAQAAVYSSSPPSEPGGLTQWRRAALEIKPHTFHLKQDQKSGTDDKQIADHLKLRILYRARQDGSFLITISLFNSLPREGNDPPSGKDCYFQTAFRITTPGGQYLIREYQSAARSLKDPEEASLALLYRNRRAYAVGHGCAAEWGAEQGGRANSVRTATIPSYTVPPLEPRSKGGDELSMYFLSGADGAVAPAKIPTTLRKLTADYAEWIKAQEAQVSDLPERLRTRAGEHIDECRECLQRITEGIELLASNQQALRAFMLANRAMLMQQYHSRRRRRQCEDGWSEIPFSYQPQDATSGRWRSFQLAFVLMNLESQIPGTKGSTAKSRSVVDLIWFPTGGGKTEAYLGLTAYTIFLRRLVRPSNAGCTALMRYTLRLLTSQQFQRASSLICACELIRQEEPSALGNERISIGLWVGQSLAPNTRKDAIDAVHGLAREDPNTENPFQILTCPWCGTAMDDTKHLGYQPRGNPRTVYLICPEKRCAFSKSNNPLPVLVVDEDIYDTPPSLVIGTVDKFAMLAWQPQAGAIFGLGSADYDPPDLIIQDELHLISGPLGSMVGLYECAIDLLSSHGGRPPKIVASTATIRRAKDQCRCLYDREVFQFPPPGLDISDSFFAKENPEAIGRRYVGVFASGAPSFVTALVRTAGALLQGCRSTPLPNGADEAVRDPYWTMLQYFSSLRELGRAATLVEADIPEFMWAIVSRLQIPKELCRRIGSPVELTSRRSAQEIPEILDRLRVTYPRAEESDSRPIDVLLATNMISVGVDIDRLGLMAVVGQPKTTSEYIQASSRVGRSAKAPGLVVTMYNPGKPRDRSHFEHFRSYHAAFYRYVEPTSVTPFSLPVLERALHALLVIVARHICEVPLPNDWDDSAEGIQYLIEFMRKRSSRIDSEHVDEVLSRLDELKGRWSQLLPSEWGNFGPPPEARPLMYPAGTSPRPEWNDLAWATPSSLRNVDVECEGRVLGIYPGESGEEHGA